MLGRLGRPFVLGGLLLVAVPAEVPAQVFFATRPHPEFAVGPLFVRATVTPALGPVPVELLWSLAVPPTRSALGLEQDLYLLWPGPVRGEPGEAAGGGDLAGYFRARGFTIIREGRLPLFEEDLYPTGPQPASRPIGQAAFVTFSREGLKPLGLSSAATYARIPWTPQLTNRTRLVKLRMILDDLVRPRTASWLEDAVWGRRHLLSIGFNDVRDQTVFPVYLENRDRLIRLADEPSQLLVSFAEAERLRIDELFPQSAGRQPAESAPRTEVVSLFLDPSEGSAPQVLTVRFGYFSRLQWWLPIVIPLLFFMLGRVAGPLLEGLVRRVAVRIHFGRQAGQGRGTEQGVILSRETLGRIVPGRTTAEEVLQLCGRDVPEEREHLAAPDRRTLVYRGRRTAPRGRRSFAWFATVSHWEVEDHEVEIALEAGVVRDVQVRVRRTRPTRAADA